MGDWILGTIFAVSLTAIAWSLLWIVLHGGRLERQRDQRIHTRQTIYELEHRLLDPPFDHPESHCETCWSNRILKDRRG